VVPGGDDADDVSGGIELDVVARRDAVLRGESLRQSDLQLIGDLLPFPDTPI